ncbi:MAG: carbohydrate kinase family protein [Blautia sp.]|nr:carbohydrate kinase family protein [Blautia sp.]
MIKQMDIKNKKRRVWVIGSAVLDLLARPIEQYADSAPVPADPADDVSGGEKHGIWQEKQRIEEIRILTGGDAANQAIHLASLGMDAELIACVGADDNGKFLRRALEDRGVGTSCLRTRSGEATGTSLVLVGKEGQRHIFSVKGAHSDLQIQDLPETFPEDLAAISLASIFSMPLLEKNGLKEFLIRAKERGILIFADLASDKEGLGLEGIRPFLSLIDYFLPSHYDIKKMTGLTDEEAQASLLHEAGCSHVILKCGEKGCYALSDGQSFRIPAAKVQVKDTTGAGDCMSAAFIYRILQKDTLEDACRFACAAGSFATRFTGASAFRLSEEAVLTLI